MERFLKNLRQAEKTIQTLDHLVYVTFPLVKDKKLLLKILLETKTAVTNLINAILQYEYVFKRVTLYDNPKKNFESFEKKCAPKYNLSNQDIKLIKELFDIAEKHKQSPFEFVRNNKVVILSENLDTKTVTFEKTKEFLELAKSILKKAKSQFLQ